MDSTILSQGEYKRGDPHPTRPGFRFYSWQKQKDKRYAAFLSPEAWQRQIDSIKKYTKAYAKTEKGRSRQKGYMLKYMKSANGYAMARFSSKQWMAKKEGIAFDLTVEDFMNIPAVCPILGVAMKSEAWGETKGASDYAPSLDRIKPSLGYTKGNVIWISYLANKIKTSANWQQIRAVADFYESLENNEKTPTV